MSIKSGGHANDIAILVRGVDEEVLEYIVQEIFKMMEACCRGKSLPIQADKTVALAFTRRYKAKTLARMIIGNTAIPYEECTKYSEIFWIGDYCGEKT